MATQLLVSVRNAIEARDALAAGADLIDMKEPLQGPLGAVDVATMRDVVACVAGRVPTSAALGELLAQPGPALAAQLPSGISFAKFGLAGCALRGDWPARFASSLASLPRGTQGVAVIYADWVKAAAPEPANVLSVAAQSACRAVLIDTWDKTAGGLLQLWTVDQCARAVERIRVAGMLAVLAGSLNALAIERLLPLVPDYVAVRGAVCDGMRVGRLDPRRVKELKRLMARVAHSNSANPLLPAACDSGHA